MFGTFGLRCITVIFLGLYAIANKCDDNINAANQALAECGVGIKNATTHCKRASDQCTFVLSSVVEHMRAAIVQMSDAVSGCFAAPRISEVCKNDGKFIGQDFAIVLTKAWEGVQDCVYSKNENCAVDVKYIMMAMDDAIASTQKLEIDCEFAPGSECGEDIGILLYQLNAANMFFASAEADCTTIGKECIEQLLIGISTFLAAASDGVLTIYVCTLSNVSMPLIYDH